MKAQKSRYWILQRQRVSLSLKDSHVPENESRTFFTKIKFLAFQAELLPISNFSVLGLSKEVHNFVLALQAHKILVTKVRVQ